MSVLCDDVGGQEEGGVNCVRCVLEEVREAEYCGGWLV
jgi:hypothetical protein